MRFTLRHLTRYTYTQPVFLEPHTIRLTPRQDASQRILEHTLTITPAPAGRWDGIDAEGNPFVQVWFHGMAAELLIEARTTALALRENPFGFLLANGNNNLPPALSPGEAAGLAACLRQETFGIGSGVRRLVEDVRERCQGRSMDFLQELNTWIFTNIAKIVRRDPGILDPEQVCSRREGACRDVAALFIACCRLAGIPARFVSGYQAGDTENPGEYDLHAWAEAYLSGAGWIGLDSTHGLVVADRHLALAASHDPELVAPTIGSFRGTGAQGSMRHDLQLDVFSE